MTEIKIFVLELYFTAKIAEVKIRNCKWYQPIIELILYGYNKVLGMNILTFIFGSIHEPPRSHIFVFLLLVEFFSFCFYIVFISFTSVGTKEDTVDTSLN